MAWFELHTNLPEHPKTMALEDVLDISTAEAVGHLCLLWAWALENAPEGDLSALSHRRLARIAGFPSERAEEFVPALIRAGFLDKKGKSLRIHDWDNYAGRYTQLKKKNAERKRRQRKEKSQAADTEDVTALSPVTSRVTSHGTSTGTSPGTATDVTGLQDSTGQDKTGQDSTEQDKKEKNIKSAGADHQAGPGAERVSDYFSSRSLEPAEFLGFSPKARGESDGMCREIFAKFCSRSPTDYDLVRFYDIVREGEALSGKRIDLICYAFEAAASVGRGGNWPYIEGVLSRLHSRGLDSLRAAEFYDIDRLDTVRREEI